MSASAEIFRFPNRGGTSSAWTNQDIADIYRCLDQFTRQGLGVEASSGISDEGDPWFAIEDVATGDALLHIARIDGFFVVHVLDGESWSGATLRDALSSIDMAAVLAAAGMDVPAAEDGNEDDRDGSHAFLRIVSAIMAVLTTDVIVNAVSHDAAAALPADTDTDGHAQSVATIDDDALALPAVESTLPATHKTEDTLSDSLTPSDAAPAKTEAHAISQETAQTADTQAATAPVATTEEAPHVDVAPVITVQTNETPVLLADDGELQFTFGTEHLQVAYDTHGHFVGTDGQADTLLIILPANGGGTSVSVDLENFDQGEDSLVVEKSDGDNTSSAIVTDLNSLLKNGSADLTIIGQSAEQINLSSATVALIAGG